MVIRDGNDHVRACPERSFSQLERITSKTKVFDCKIFVV